MQGAGKSRRARALTAAPRRPSCYIGFEKLAGRLCHPGGEGRRPERRSDHRSRCWLVFGGFDSDGMYQSQMHSALWQASMPMHVTGALPLPLPLPPPAGMSLRSRHSCECQPFTAITLKTLCVALIFCWKFSEVMPQVY